ncbi:hypothetical protein ACFWVF_19715 [Streptomyces sp. NPDC058659]|uniref:hypothetical protein n=1 Tax=unclassified Streptomyces TaxID=2593676 RepID=UPI003663FD11
MLPLEAIELDAFRRQHEHDTFWCGLLLGGCGGQLTTKLYTDRVRHFAHFPGPDGHPHLCGRSARGVASADHLYMKAAADVWLRARGTQAGFDFVQPDGVPVGSVVDIQLPHRKLRVHLDKEVAPDWDAEHEPVLGVSVPVDSDTLIDRWYVHRIRLDSEGTTRRVRIGTEAFDRPTEWFALDECEITDRGLSTPAVERIVQARNTPSSTVWTPGKKQEEPEQDVQAHELMRRLLYARRIESTDLAQEVCREITELAGVSPQLQHQLDAARRNNALLWVKKETEARQELFARLNQAMADQKTGRVKALLAEGKTVTRDGRSEEEEHRVRAAADYLAAVPGSHRDRQARGAPAGSARAVEPTPAIHAFPAPTLHTAQAAQAAGDRTAPPAGRPGVLEHQAVPALRSGPRPAVRHRRRATYRSGTESAACRPAAVHSPRAPGAAEKARGGPDRVAGVRRDLPRLRPESRGLVPHTWQTALLAFQARQGTHRAARAPLMRPQSDRKEVLRSRTCMFRQDLPSCPWRNGAAVQGWRPRRDHHRRLPGPLLPVRRHGPDLKGEL